jgi:hypothetical protein
MGLFDLFNSDAADAAAARKSEGYKQGYSFASAGIDAAKKDATDWYTKAALPFETLYTRGLKGYDAYADASGVNGAEGYARARENFQTNPGYQFALDQALDANDRRAASRGMLGSGNTIADTVKLATGYADQGWKDYVSALAPNLNAANAAAAGQAGAYTGLGGTLNADELARAQYGWNKEVGVGNALAEAQMDRVRAAQASWDTIFKGGEFAGKALGLPGFTPRR